MKRLAPSDPYLFYGAVGISLWTVGMTAISISLLHSQPIAGILLLYTFAVTPAIISAVMWVFVFESCKNQRDMRSNNVGSIQSGPR
jgi:hypothetical protein